MSVRAHGAMPAREFSKGHKHAATGPVEYQSRVLTNWGKLVMGRSAVRGGVDVARVNWKGFIAQPADMRVRVVMGERRWKELQAKTGGRSGTN